MTVDIEHSSSLVDVETVFLWITTEPHRKKIFLVQFVGLTLLSG
jgi:hypothetical protein